MREVWDCGERFTRRRIQLTSRMIPEHLRLAPGRRAGQWSFASGGNHDRFDHCPVAASVVWCPVTVFQGRRSLSRPNKPGLPEYSEVLVDRRRGLLGREFRSGNRPTLLDNG